MQRYTKTGTAQDKTLIHAGSANISFQIYNNDDEVRYVQLFDAAATSAVTLGTTAPKCVMVLPASGGNTWDNTWRTFFESGCVIAVTTTRTGATTATAAADYEVRY